MVLPSEPSTRCYYRVRARGFAAESSSLLKVMSATINGLVDMIRYTFDITHKKVTCSLFVHANVTKNINFLHGNTCRKYVKVKYQCSLHSDSKSALTRINYQRSIVIDNKISNQFKQFTNLQKLRMILHFLTEQISKRIL